jgi:hypothetical protein
LYAITRRIVPPGEGVTVIGQLDALMSVPVMDVGGTPLIV